MTKVVNLGSLEKRIYRKKGTDIKITLKKKVQKCHSLLQKINSERKRLYCKFDEYMYYYSDKITREGLFGEDKGKGYCGTDVDFIPEEAYEYNFLKKKARGL